VTSLLSVKPYKLFKALRKSGFYVHHQTGSHLVLKHSGDATKRVILPMHKKELKTGTLRSILAQAGITPEELKKLL